MGKKKEPNQIEYINGMEIKGIKKENTRPEKNVKILKLKIKKWNWEILEWK